MALYPRNFFRRVVETVELDGDSLDCTVAYDIVLPDSAVCNNEPVLIPVTEGDRDVLEDNHALLQDGKSVSVLNQIENIALAQLLILAAVRRAFPPAATPVADLAVDVDPAEAERVKTWGKRLCRVPELSVTEAKKIAAAVQGEILAAYQITPRLTELFNICRFLSTRYYIFGELGPSAERPSRIRLVRNYKAQHNNQTKAGVLLVLRRTFGRQPFEIVLPVRHTHAVDSYHLKLVVPSGHHAHQMRLLSRDRGGTRQYSSLDLKDAPRGHYRQSRSKGNTAHAHFHRFGDWHPAGYTRENSPDYAVKVTFAEDLPGSVSATFLPPAILLLVTFLIRTKFSAVFVSDKPELNSAFPAFLLALPGIVGIWLRPNDKYELVRGPLVAAVAPLITGVISASFAIAFLYYRLVPTGSAPRIHSRATHWSLALAVAALWVLVIGFLTVRKVLVELHCAATRVDKREKREA